MDQPEVVSFRVRADGVVVAHPSEYQISKWQNECNREKQIWEAEIAAGRRRRRPFLSPPPPMSVEMDMQSIHCW